MKDKIFLSCPVAICSCGKDLQSIWQNVIQGNNEGLKKVSYLGENQFFTGRINDQWLSPTDDIYDSRVLQVLDVCLKQIAPLLKLALSKYEEKRVAVCIGSCDNQAEFSLQNHIQFFKTGEFPQNYTLQAQSPQYPAFFAAKKMKIKGACFGFATACASSNSAVIKASQLVRAGLYDAVLAGGVDVASNTATLGFSSLGAISKTRTNPFSKNRNGINIGEGSALFLVSKEPLCNDSIELAGIGESCDANHMTCPKQQGDIAVLAMQKALLAAKLSIDDIDYINLHGTGTVHNDAAEANALNLLCRGDMKRLPPCSSTKAIMGHTLGAAGALELALCYMVLRQEAKEDCYFLPPHLWDGQFDDDLPSIPFVPCGYSTKKQPHHCMSQSFAFGGCNTCLIVEG